MNIDDVFSAVMQKYHLKTPLPPEVQKELFNSKKTCLKNILSANKSYSFSVRSTMSVFYTAMKLDLNLSISRSRKFAAAGSLAAVILIITSILLITIPNLYHVSSATVVICKSGDAVIERHSKERIELKPGEMIKKGDKVTTGPASFVIIQIGENKLIRIQSNTKIEATSIPGSGVNEIYLRTGTILAGIKKLKNNESFIIRSASAIARVLGTEFSITCTKRGCIVAVKEGSVELTHLASSHSINLDAGFAALADTSMERRKTTAVERLEIQRMEAVSNQEHPGSLNDAEKSEIFERVKKNDEEIDKKINRLKAQLPLQTIDEIREKYGRIDVVTTFSGKSYKGAIISRGKRWKMLVPGRYVNIPSNTIQSSKNVW